MFKRRVLKMGRRKIFRLTGGKKKFENRVFGVMHPEFKVFNNDGAFTAATGIGGASSSSTISTLLLPQITQGDGSNNRSGNRILVKGFYFKFYMFSNQNSSAVSIQTFRLVVVRDYSNQNGAAAFNASTLFNIPSTNSYTEMAYQFPSTSKYWEIIFDTGVQTLARPLNLVQSGSQTGDISHYFKSFYYSKPFVVVYDASTGAVSDVTQNMIYVIAWSSYAFAPLLYWTTRVRFIDC